MYENDKLKEYEFVEGMDFDGLVPNADKKAPARVGSSNVSVGFYRSFRGSDAMEIADIASFYESSGPSPVPPQPPVRPDETENTPEQQDTEDSVISGVTAESGGTKSVSAIAESVNNIVIPSNSARGAYVEGPVQDGATFTNESSAKFVTINNTNEEPVDVSVITSGGSVYLRGDYNDIYLEGKSLPVSSSIYPNVHGTVNVADTNQNVALSLNFVGDDCGVVYYGENDLTVNDGNTGVTGSPTIYAPNATVKMNGQYDEVTVTCSDNTLVLNNGFHAKKLTVLKGNVFVNGINDISTYADSLNLHKGCVVTYAEVHVWQDSYAALMGASPANAKVILDTNIEVSKGRILGALASGKEIIDLNGHTWKCGDTRATTANTGSYLLRNAAQTTIKDSAGQGVFENNHGDYLIWANGERVVVNIESGEYRGYTHTLYAYLGTINVYGGTFKLLDADTAERDSKGNLKFLLNCYDANYTAGTAKINVYGGKFYEFNPAESYGEPGGPVSFVASGYHVVESVEDGLKVYEVVAD